MNRFAALKKRKSVTDRRPAEKIFLGVFFVFFVIHALTLFYPFLWCILNSFKSNFDFLENPFGLPREFMFENFARVFTEVKINGARIGQMYLNSIWMTILYVVANIGCSTLSAYALSKFRFPGKTLIFSIAILIQVMPIIGTGPALYKFLYTFGIANNPALIWLMWAGGFDFAFIVLYGYFNSVSNTYSEAACIDGAGNFITMVRIVVPQAIPAIASLMVLNVITAWNDYTTPMLYMRGYPNLALGIYLFEQESQFASIGMPILFATIILAILPLAALFIGCQKMIMTNVTGGLKG